MENIKCKICCKRFSIERKQQVGDLSSNESFPILVKCGHTFCQKCIMRCVSVQKAFKCPTCKVETQCNYDKNGIKGLFPNVAIIGHLFMDRNCLKLRSLDKSLQAAAERGKPWKSKDLSQKCSECIKDVALLSCLQCGVGFCSKCFEQTHRNSRVFRRHQGIPFNQQSERDLSSLDCHQHHSLMEHYCVDDEKLICRDCIAFDHASHTVISLRVKSEEMSDQIREAVQSALPILHQLKLHINTIDEEMKEIKLQALENEALLIQQYLYLAGLMQANFLFLIGEMDKISAVNIKKLIPIKEAATKQLQSLQNTMSDATMIINMESSGDPVVIDPFKTLFNLKKAGKTPCVLKKLPIDLESKKEIVDNDEKVDLVDEDRFVLSMHEDATEACRKWASIDETCNFKYSVILPKENDLCDVEKDCELISNSDASSVASENILQIDVGTKQKLRIIQVPPANNQELVYVKWIKSPLDFFIQRSQDGKQVSFIERTLKAFTTQPFQEKDVPNFLRVGEICVANFRGKWYRCKVVAVFKDDSVNIEDEELIVDDSTAGIRDSVEIHYIDYGNNDRVQVSSVRCLPRNLQRIPCLAIPCTLAGVEPFDAEAGWSKEAQIAFYKMVKDRPVLMTTLTREAGRRFVDLHKPAPDEIDIDIPVSIRDALLYLDMARFSENQIPTSDLQLARPQTSVGKRRYLNPTTLMPREYINVTLSDFRSLDKFSVQQLDSSAEYLESMTNKIQRFVVGKWHDRLDPSAPFTLLFPAPGMICLAKYKHCDAWYRAVITQILDDKKKVRVMYVDYGNEEVVKVVNTLKIPDEFLKLPQQALSCKLADINPVGGNEEWAIEVKERFMELAGQDKSLIMYIRSRSDFQYNVELFDANDFQEKSENQVVSVNERLVYEGLATGITVRNIARLDEKGMNHYLPTFYTTRLAAESKQAQVAVEDLLDTPNGSPASSVKRDDPELEEEVDTWVTVSFVESPASIFVQTKEQWLACNQLIRDLHKQFADVVLEVEADEMPWKAGDTCAVLSKIEKRWCRARIERFYKENSCEVRLTDIGTKEILPLSNLRPIPEQYSHQAATVTKCRLIDISPAGGSKWTMTSCDTLKEMISGKECRLEVAPEEREEALLLCKLFLPPEREGGEEKDVVKELVIKGVALPVRLGMFKSARDAPSKDYFELAESPECFHGNFTSRPPLQSPKSSVKKKLDLVRTPSAESPPRKTPLKKKKCISDLQDPCSPEEVSSAKENENDEDSIISQSVAQDKEIMPNEEAQQTTQTQLLMVNPKSELKDAEKKASSEYETKPEVDLEDVFADAEECASNSAPVSDRKASESSTSSTFDVAMSSQQMIDLDDKELQLRAPYSSRSTIRARIPAAELPAPGSTFPCIVTHIESHNVVYVRRLPASQCGPSDDDIRYLPPLELVEPGAPCVARYSADGRWYRAEVIKYYRGQGLAKVLYVDYGLHEVVAVQDMVRMLTAEYSRRPAQAIQCTLFAMPQPADLMLAEAVLLNTLAALIGNQELECRVHSVNNDMWDFARLCVNLYSGRPRRLLTDQLMEALFGDVQ